TLHVIPLAEMVGELAVPGTFTPAGPLPVAVSDVEPIRLANGKVLLAGGVGADGLATKATALFDPVINTWTPADPLITERRAHSTTLLADGRVLVAGGLDANGTALGSAEIYDPIAATWTAVPVPMVTARFGHSATALTNGKVLVAGGTGKRGDRDGAALSTAELFTPAEGKWSEAKPMTDARTGHRAVLLDSDTVLGDDTVLVIGGELTTGGRGAALAGCETYDSATGTWTPTAGELGLPRAGHQATLLADGSVLVSGGDPVAPRLEFPQHEDPPFRPDGLATAERYDPDARTWRPVADLPGGRTSAPAVHLRSGRVLVMGGTGGPARDTGYRSVVSHHPGDGTWTAAGSLGSGR
ncbi:MAG: Kelch repeat-containing protein, partial [Pseudonocardiaceae bacterium]